MEDITLLKLTSKEKNTITFLDSITATTLANSAITGTAISNSYSCCLSIYNYDGTLLVNISRDGALEFGQNYNPSLAAEIFWNAMARVSPQKLQNEISELKTQITSLQEQLKQK